ncbi:COPII coat Sec23p-Sfb3p heterodimer component [Cladochytrium tenue]|nr:COPII coat Sec23p-Sfb3p heterodimer component [Cladochytrium tenue]
MVSSPQPAASPYGMPPPPQPQIPEPFAPGQPQGPSHGMPYGPGAPQPIPHNGQFAQQGPAPAPGFRPGEPSSGAPPPFPNQSPAITPGYPQPGFPNDPARANGYGAKPAAPRNRIDPNQIPSPLFVQEADQAAHEGKPFSTYSRTMPPLASSRFCGVDEGNCNPRFMRLTTYHIPCTEELLTTSNLPMGAVIQPMADLAPDEV